jgi:isopenicillin-N N-acyltransferase-like protein
MTDSSLLELPEVVCSGSPRELGRAQGEALRGKIAAFVDQRQAALAAYLEDRKQSARFAEFLLTGKRCFEAARDFDPEGTSEHEGIAEGAGVDAGMLYAVTNMTDVRDVLVLPADPARDGCTSLLVPSAATREGRLLAGQTWDLNPTDLEFVVAVHRKPSDGPETWSVTCSGSLSLVGMNAEGVAIGTTNIKTRASRVGVGYLSVLHRMIRCRSRRDAREWARRAPRAAAHTYWIADADGADLLETDPLTVSERELATAALVETNHCQADALARREGEPPLPSSHARLARARQVLERGGHDVASLRTLFADRSDGFDSINRYAEDGQGTSTNACIICVPAMLEFWACRGSADRGRWRKLSF